MTPDVATVTSVTTLDPLDQPVTRWRLARHYFAAILMLALVWGAYQIVIAPWIEPHRANQVEPVGPDDKSVSFGLPPDIARLFPEGSWERSEPRVLATGSGLLLFQKRESHSDGRMVIRPCTLVLHIDGQANQDRPIVIRAPQGAVLRFDQAFQISQGTFGRFLGGQLEGPVTIDRPPSVAGGDDGFHAQTREIQLSPTQVWTSQPVQFQYGRHYGSGRDLILALAKPQESRRGFTVGQPRELELVHVDQIVLEIPPQAAQLPANAQHPRNNEPSTLRLTCDGSFIFDFTSGAASLNKSVRGIHVTPTGLIDQMTAKRLELSFKSTRPMRQPKKTRSNEIGAQLQTVKLSGNPARINAPSQMLRADASTIQVNYLQRELRLSDPVTARMQFQKHEFSAPSLTYRAPVHDPQRLGAFETTGPGRYRQWNGVNSIQIDWKGVVSLAPHADQHVLSVPEGATVRFGNEVFFKASELHLWLKEIPIENSVTTVEPEAVDKKTANDSANPQPVARYQPQPTRLRATGEIQFAIRGLSGETQLLECWMSYQNPLETSNENVGHTRPSRALLGLPQSDKDQSESREYKAIADVIRLQLIRKGRQWNIHQGQLSGRVVLREEPGGTLTGDTVELLQGIDGLSRLDISGQPAEVQRNGMSLKGESIHVDQTIGRMWIEGAGEMVLPPTPASGTRQMTASSPVALQWKTGMEFDGRRAAFRGNVVVVADFEHRNKKQRSRCSVRGEAMTITVAPSVNFRQPPKGQQVSLSEIEFPGTVAMNHVLQNSNQAMVSRESLFVRDLWVNYTTGEFKSPHPGWGESVRLTRTLKGASVPAGVPVPAADELIYVRVDFRQEMSGNFLHKVASFSDQVRAVVGPVRTWEGRLDPLRPENLGPRAFLLNCNELTVMQVPNVQPATIELQAQGSVRVDGQLFAATGERLVYDQTKDVILLDGQGRVPAKLRYRSAPNAPASEVTTGSIRYSPKTGQLLSTGIQGAQVIGPGQ